jgi:hypothetical protein
MQQSRGEQGLQGRVALVTGAAIGNGRAFCVRLAHEGARIAIADIADASETAEAVRRLGAEVLTIRADLTKPSDVEAMMECIRAHWGGVDILVHNVGFYEEEPFELLTFEQWRYMLDVTLNSLFLTVKAVLPSMKERGFGRIIAAVLRYGLAGNAVPGALRHGEDGHHRVCALAGSRGWALRHHGQCHHRWADGNAASERGAAVADDSAAHPAAAGGPSRR